MTWITILAVLWILLLLAPTVFILLDLKSGITKARMRGERITSDKTKRTVAKFTRYYAFVLVFAVLDLLQMGTCWYFNNFYQAHIPIFCLLTCFPVIFVAFIEVKSIQEPYNVKEAARQEEVGKLLEDLIKHRGKLDESAADIISYISRNEKIMRKVEKRMSEKSKKE